MIQLAPKPLLWAGSSRKDMRGLPPAVRRSFGLWLFAVQCGEMPPAAKPLKGFGGPGVIELIEEDRSGSYRAVYTARFRDAVYVLHVFQKKSKRGIATPAHDIAVIRQRLKWVQEAHAGRVKETKT